MKLLLLLSLFSYGGTTISVSEKKGGNVTLSCDIKDKEISNIRLSRQSKNVNVDQKKNCSHRICKKGKCDVVIKNLRLNDTGTYVFRVYSSDAHGLDDVQQEKTYRLHVYDEISVKKGERLKMDALLLPHGKQINHQPRSSTEWMEVWKRGDGIHTDGDGNLKEFTASEDGTYRVLDADGKILISVLVRGSDVPSPGKLNSTNDTTKRDHWFLIGPAGLFVLVLVVLFLAATIIKFKFQ